MEISKIDSETIFVIDAIEQKSVWKKKDLEARKLELQAEIEKIDLMLKQFK